MNLSTITSNIREFAKDWKKAIMISIMNAIFITILTYVLDNQPLFTGENLSHYAFVELFKNKVMDSDNITNEKAFFINVAYDKQLVPYYENNLEEGNVVITDRTKLYDLLKKLQRVDNYRYVFLDIRFEKGIQDTLIDSKLFNEIKSMRNIVVATHKDSEIPDSKIISKTARSDYYYSILSTTFCTIIFSTTVYVIKDSTKLRNFDLIGLKGIMDNKDKFINCNMEIRKNTNAIVNTTITFTICLPSINDIKAL